MVHIIYVVVVDFIVRVSVFVEIKEAPPGIMAGVVMDQHIAPRPSYTVHLRVVKPNVSGRSPHIEVLNRYAANLTVRTAERMNTLRNRVIPKVRAIGGILNDSVGSAVNREKAVTIRVQTSCRKGADGLTQLCPTLKQNRDGRAAGAATLDG